MALDLKALSKQLVVETIDVVDVPYASPPGKAAINGQRERPSVTTSNRL